MEAPLGLVFDLDGTLVDSRLDLAAAVNRMRRELGLPELDTRHVVPMVGHGARELVRRALAEDGAEARLEDAYPLFLGHYRELCLHQTRPYSGVPELLASMGSLLPMAVLTNKPLSFTLQLLQGLGLEPWFAEVVAGDSLPTKKPDPEGFLLLAARLGVPPRRCLMVGDSAVDAATASAAGAPFALCDWGFAPGDVAPRAAVVRAPTPQALHLWLQTLVGPATAASP